MSECSCRKCQEMCQRPCWPSPEEADQMLDDGLGPKMMLDWWAAEEDIYLICPAEPGREKDRASSYPRGGCVLQNPNGLCSIHNSGYKPLEGRTAMCSEKHPNLHRDVAALWDNDEGREVVEKWKRLVGY